MAELVVYNAGSEPIGVDFESGSTYSGGMGYDVIVFPAKELLIISNLSEEVKAYYTHKILEEFNLILMHEYLAKCKNCEWYKPLPLAKDLSRDEYRSPYNHVCLKVWSDWGEKSFCHYASSICDLGIVPEPPTTDRFELMDMEE